MDYEGYLTAARVQRDWKINAKALQLKKKSNYVVIWQKNKGGGREGIEFLTLLETCLWRPCRGLNF